MAGRDVSSWRVGRPRSEALRRDEVNDGSPEEQAVDDCQPKDRSAEVHAAEPPAWGRTRDTCYPLVRLRTEVHEPVQSWRAPGRVELTGLGGFVTGLGSQLAEPVDESSEQVEAGHVSALPCERAHEPNCSST